MADRNQVILEGQIASDIQVRDTPSSRVANFTVLTTETRGTKTYREFNRCVAWGELAGVVEGKREGEAICLEGRLQTRSFEDKNSGAKRWVTEVNVRRIVTSRRAAPVPPSASEEIDDDVPF